MDTKQIINQQVDVYRYRKNDTNEGYYLLYTTTMINFFTKDAVKNKMKIEYLRRLNEKDEKLAKQYKKENLIGCTVSGTFGKRRVALCIDKRTGVIAIDIDKDKNPYMDINKAKQDVMKLPFVFMSMLSCRGEGIFCLVYYNKDKYIGHIFNALKDEFKAIGYNIDNSCSDICRLRYISWDDKILMKNDVEMYNEIKIPEEREYSFEDDWELTKQDLKDIVNCIYVLVNYNNYTSDDYDEWLLDGFRLATIPNKVVGLKLFEMISENSLNFKDYDDVKQKFEECRRTTTYKTNILGYYINKIKEIYGPDWRYRLNDILK